MFCHKCLLSFCGLVVAGLGVEDAVGSRRWVCLHKAYRLGGKTDSNEATTRHLTAGGRGNALRRKTRRP